MKSNKHISASELVCKLLGALRGTATLALLPYFVAAVGGAQPVMFIVAANAAPIVHVAEAGQDKLPKVADPPVNGENGGGSKPVKSDAKAQTRRPRPVPQKPLPPVYDVVFITNVPDAEIFINPGTPQAKLLGTTDAEGKLNEKLVRGRHQIIASKKGHRIIRQQIVIRTNNQTFNFNIGEAALAQTASAATETPTAAPVAEPTSTPAGAETSAVNTPDDPAEKRRRVEEIMKRFLDAKETGSVTTADWEFVLAQTGAELARDPANSDLQAQALFAQGQIALMQAEYPNALVNFNKAVIANPKMLAAHYGLGNAYLATNQPAEAVKSYKRAGQLDAQFTLWLKSTGDALSKQGKSKEASGFYERFKVAGGQTATDPNLNAALSLLKRKRWEQALKEFQEVSKYQNTSDIYLYIGDSYTGLEQPLSASQAYQKAIELDPKSALANFKYGEVMFSLREYTPALEAFERALALDLTGTTINRSKAREMANKAGERLRKTK